MIKAIFWDNDGVLVDTEKLYFRACRDTFAKIGFDLTEELYTEYFLKRSEGTWHIAREMGFDEGTISELRKERNALYSKLLADETKVNDGVVETLEVLKRKVKMGIVTSSRKDHFNIIHQRTGLLKYFDFVVTSDECANTKPDPEPYIRALQKSGMNSDECIVIEDSERGLRSAMTAGLKCFVVPTKLTEKSDFTGAAKILSNAGEIISEIDVT
ncbi:MAG: HAD family phosphatase [Bacteroidota bacterium]